MNVKKTNKIVFKKPIYRALCIDDPKEISGFKLEWFLLLSLLENDMIEKDLNDKLICLCHMNILKVVDVYSYHSHVYYVHIYKHHRHVTCSKNLTC